MEQHWDLTQGLLLSLLSFNVLLGVVHLLHWREGEGEKAFKKDR